MFLIVATLPIVLMSAVSHLAIGGVTEQQAQRGARAAARAAGQAVVSHLQVASDLLRGPSAPDATRVFAGSPDTPELIEDWRVAHAAPRASLVSARPTAELRTLAGAAGRTRVLMRVGSPSGERIAEVSPEFLWDLMQEPRTGERWEVRDAQGQLLFAVGDIETTGVEHVESWPLFLGASFDTSDWEVSYRYAPQVTLLHGSPLTRWLAAVAITALLAAALLAALLIRRTMRPLAQLEEGTGALSRREYGTRIRVDSNDEFADLAAAFNRMAERIERQFRSIEQAGAIDRAMLAGERTEAAVERLLAAAQTMLPATAVAFVAGDAKTLQVAWRDGATADTRRCRVDASMPLLDAAAAHWLPPGDAAWSAALPFAAGHGLLVLPLPATERARAALVVAAGDRGELDEATPFLCDLRDRIALGISADERRTELQRRALVDPLTGVANRRGLTDHLVALARSAAPPVHAVLFIDLDHFKSVNDSLGHDVGDDVIVEAAGRLGRMLRGDSLIARQGGDEFVAVVPVAGAEAAMAVAARIDAALSQPFVRRGRSFVLGASVGVAIGPVEGEDPAGELLRRADMAMYAAKQEGGGGTRLYDERLDARANEQAQLLADLRAAVENDEFVVEYQPRIDARSGVIVACEALVRWMHPQRGLLMPGRFIPLAEQSSLIEAIDAIVLRRACQQWRRWADAGLRLHHISVNTSARALGQGRLPARVREALETSGTPAAALELEITETVLAEGSETVIGELSELQASGITLALDDFGTGYSTMATLRRLPVDVIKIDRAFVKDLEADPMAHAVLGAVVALAEVLDLRTVAEGVETEGQRDALRSLGVGELQGYLLGRPCPAAAFERLAGLRRSALEAETN